MTLGNTLFESEEVNQLINQLVQKVVSQSEKLTEVKNLETGESDYKKALEEIASLRGRPLFHPYIGSGLGHGPLVELANGSVKLDLINGIGVHLFGHSHPELIRTAIKGALADVTNLGHLQPNLEYVQFSSKLVELAKRKSRLEHAWITTSGSMANEDALKLVRQKNTPRRKIISFENAFAGRTTMMAEVTDNPAYKVGLPDYHEVLRVPFYETKDVQSTERAHKIFKEHVDKHGTEICAFMFEPMLGEGGYKVAPKEFFIPMLEICKKNNIAVWADEIQTFTRTGQFFAFETIGIGDYIDICTIAKTAQVAVTLFTKEYNPQPGLIAGTFSGGPVSLAVGTKILEILDNENYMGPEGKISKIHSGFVGMLNRLNESSCKGQLRDAGGLGLMVAVTPLDGTKETMLNLSKVLFKHGIVTYGCGRDPYRIRFLPACFEEKHILMAEKIIEKAIQELM